MADSAPSSESMTYWTLRETLRFTKRNLFFRFAAQARRMGKIFRRHSDSLNGPQPFEIPQNGLGNGCGLSHPFVAPVGSGVSASRTMSLSATSFVSSASRSGSAIRPRVEAIQRCWTAIAVSAIRRPASVR
jgi:hypothetical protein